MRFGRDLTSSLITEQKRQQWFDNLHFFSALLLISFELVQFSTITESEFDSIADRKVHLADGESFQSTN